MNAGENLTIAMLLATPGTDWGGMEKHTVELADALAHRGHIVHLIAHPTYEHQIGGAIQFHPLPVHLGRRNPILQWKLRRTLRRIGPDIGHGHGNKAIDLLGRTKLEITKVGTVHGIKKHHNGLAKMDAVICISKAVMATLDHPRKILIYHGSAHKSELETASHLSSPGNPSAIQAVAIGRLEAVKGFDALISAWAKLNNPPKLAILGEGSQRSVLEKQIANAGLSSRIFLPGFQQDVGEWLKHADVCVISSHREGLSYVLIEALQAGCPVLSTPIAGAQELLPSAALAENSSPEAIYQLLNTHLPALEKLRLKEQYAVAYARTELTIEAMVARTEEVYLKLAAMEPNQ